MEFYIQLVLMIANGLLTLGLSWAGYKINQYRKFEEERKKKEIARDNLLLAMSRTMIIRECNHYIAKGHAPLYAVSAITAMYEAYRDLDGNGAVTSIYSDFIVLPHSSKEESA